MIDGVKRRKLKVSGRRCNGQDGDIIKSACQIPKRKQYCINIKDNKYMFILKMRNKAQILQKRSIHYGEMSQNSVLVLGKK